MLNAILSGYIGSVRSNDAGSVTNISIAVTEKWVDANGKKQERTDWYNVGCFGKLGEVVREYKKVGDYVVVAIDRIHARHYTDKNGETQVSVECRARSVEFGPSKERSSSNGNGPVDVDVEDFATEEIPF